MRKINEREERERRAVEEKGRKGKKVLQSKRKERDRWGFREIDKMRFREKLHRTRGRTLIIT